MQKGRIAVRLACHQCMFSTRRSMAVLLGIMVVSSGLFFIGGGPQEPTQGPPVTVYSAGLDPTGQGAWWWDESNQVGAMFGCSVSPAGDVNGDGFEDVIVGAPYYMDIEGHEAGRIFVYYGSATGLPEAPSWWTSPQRPYVGYHFGGSVSGAGDVNGDGFDDVIVGAPGHNTMGIGGYACVYFGSATGLSDTQFWWITDQLPITSPGLFGYSVASAGDVNGDGFDDVIVGEPSFDWDFVDQGCVWVFYGRAGDWWDYSWREGPWPYANFGTSVAPAGDVNKDGYDDVIIGAPYDPTEYRTQGSAYVYFGSATGISEAPSWEDEGEWASGLFGTSVSAGDANNDGFVDVIVGEPGCTELTGKGRTCAYYGTSAGLPAQPSWVTYGDEDWCFFGDSVSSGGDINGDGFDDVVIGATQYRNGQGAEGRAYVYLGSATGFSRVPRAWFEGNQFAAYFGYSVSLGDVNGDGRSDLIIGAPCYDNGEGDEGCAFVYTKLPLLRLRWVHLPPGWNMFAHTLRGYMMKASFLGLSFGDMVVGWNSSSASYSATFIVGISPPSKDFTIEPSTGYWIYASGARNITLYGEIPDGVQNRNITVKAGAGWFLLGLNSLNESRHASDVLAMYSVAGGVQMVVSWDPLTKAYRSWISAFPMMNNFLLIPDQGYWVYVNGSGTLTYNP